jgi:hypothetical protein
MTDTTTTAAPAVAPAAAPSVPPAIQSAAHNLLFEIESIPNWVTSELSLAKAKIVEAIAHFEAHFASAKAAAEADAGPIKTDATDVQSAVEKAT